MNMCAYWIKTMNKGHTSGEWNMFQKDLSETLQRVNIYQNSFCNKYKRSEVGKR